MTTKRSIKSITSEFTRLSTRAEKNDIMARYRLGELVKELSSLHGVAGIQEAVVLVGKSKGYLYQHSAVVNAWTKAQLKAVLKKSKDAVTWSHLVALSSTAMSKQERAAWIGFVISRGLSVLEIQSEMDKCRTQHLPRKDRRMKWHISANIYETRKVLLVKEALALFYADSKSPSVGEFIYEAAEALLFQMKTRRSVLGSRRAA